VNYLSDLILKLYVPIITAVLVGIILSFCLRLLGKKNLTKKPWDLIIPNYLGKFLFFIGVPISVINFIHKADLSGTIWLSPLTAWCAILISLFCSWLWLQIYGQNFSIPAQGSFTLVSMVGNTSYVGFPIVLLLPQLGANYFAWAILYDVLGTFLGAYGLGAFLSARTARRSQVATAAETILPISSSDFSVAISPHAQVQKISIKFIYFLAKIITEILKNPTLIAFAFGIFLRLFIFPEWLDVTLHWFAWGVIMSSLVLMGVRLQQLNSWGNLKPALGAVVIKMFLVPLIIAMLLTSFGLDGPPRLVLILQSAMPCAFATLVLAEAYNLDRDLVVAALGLSSLALVFLLPFWLWGFATW
jgi:predicted permease